MNFINKVQQKLLPHPKDPVVIYAAKALMKRYGEDKLSQLGGQLAYFFILSLFPFLMLVHQIVAMLNIDTQAMVQQLHLVIPENMLYVIDAYMKQIAVSESSGIFTFGAIFTIGLASKAITSLLHSLHRAFRVEDKLTFFKSLISYPFTAIMLLLMFLSLVFASVGKELFNKIIVFFGMQAHWSTIWQIVRWSIPLGGMILLLTILYNLIPPRKFPRRYTFVGAIFAVCLWVIMAVFISFYTSNFGRYSIIYGSLGAIMIMLLFLYWSGIIVVLGGELAHILAMRSQGRFEYDVPSHKS